MNKLNLLGIVSDLKVKYLLVFVKNKGIKDAIKGVYKYSKELDAEQKMSPVLIDAVDYYKGRINENLDLLYSALKKEPVVLDDSLVGVVVNGQKQVSGYVYSIDSKLPEQSKPKFISERNHPLVDITYNASLGNVITRVGVSVTINQGDKYKGDSVESLLLSDR